LHERVARNGETYSMTYDASVREAVENEGVAPSEYITVLPRSGGTSYLLRLIYPEQFDGSDAIEAVARIQQALALMELTDKGTSSTDEDEATINVQFTVGFLDNLGIGALLVDAQGEIVGYNPSLRAQLGENDPGERLEDFLRLLIDSGQERAAEAVLSHLTAAADNDVPDPRIRVRMPAGDQVELTVVRLSNEPGDSSACLVTLPRSESAASVSPMVHAWRNALQRVEATAEDLAGAAEQFQHRHQRKLGRDRAGLLARLENSSRNLRGQLREVRDSLRLAAETEPSATVDLGAMVDHLVNELAAADPSRTIVCEHAEIPSVSVPPAGMEQVLRAILIHAADRNDSNEVRFSITAELEPDCYRLTVSDNGPGLPEDCLDDLGGCLQRQGSASGGDDAGATLTPALARQFLNQIGGDLRLESAPGRGATVLIKIPREDA
jgi:signal transduction histidine kinase